MPKLGLDHEDEGSVKNLQLTLSPISIKMSSTQSLRLQADVFVWIVLVTQTYNRDAHLKRDNTSGNCKTTQYTRSHVFPSHAILKKIPAHDEMTKSVYLSSLSLSSTGQRKSHYTESVRQYCKEKTCVTSSCSCKDHHSNCTWRTMTEFDVSLSIIDRKTIRKVTDVVCS